jgi:hypothetical protein
MLCSHCTEGHVRPGTDREHVCALTGLPVPDSKLLWGCPLEIDVFTHAGRVKARVLLCAAHVTGRAEELAGMYPANVQERFALIVRSEELAAAPIHGGL